MTRHLYRLSLAAFAAALTAPALAAEPNNLPTTATELSAAVRSLNDSLDGNSGRPDTLLGRRNPAFNTLFEVNNDGPAGNGKGSQLLGMPVLSNGGAYFSVTGAPDNLFIKNHQQLGNYKISFDVRDPNGNLVPGKSFVEYSDISPFEMDNVWMNPSASPDPNNPNWVGYTVDVTVDNVIGPGTSDSLDFFRFTGFDPFEPFTAKLTNLEFAGMVGWYTTPNQLAGKSDPLAAVPTVSGFADADGEVLLGVTGAPDLTFIGQHTLVGNYTLSIVPEPSGLLALGLGAACCGWQWMRTRRRKRGVPPG